MTAKVQVATLSIFSNTILIIIKLSVGIITSSASIISKAIHSTMDLLASIIAFFSVKTSDKPADDYHPYGHGKEESFHLLKTAFTPLLDVKLPDKEIKIIEDEIN